MNLLRTLKRGVTSSLVIRTTKRETFSHPVQNPSGRNKGGNSLSVSMSLLVTASTLNCRSESTEDEMISVSLLARANT